MIIVFALQQWLQESTWMLRYTILPVLSIYNPESRNVIAFCLTQSHKVTTKSRGENRLLLKIRSTILSHAPWFPKQHWCLEGSQASSLVLLVTATHKIRWVWYWQGKNTYRGGILYQCRFKNLTWTNLWSNPDLCSDRPATNNLKRDAAFCLNCVARWY